MAPLTRARRRGGSWTDAGLRVFVGLLVLSLFCEASKKVTFNVPSKLEAGTLIGRLNLRQHLRPSDQISSSDPNFIVLEDGSLYTTNDVSLSSEKKVFTISLNDLQGHLQKKIHVNLLSHPKRTHKTGETVLRRTKRRWAPVPTLIMENSLGPFPMQIQQLSSDTAQKYNVTYSISGRGVDQPPLNYFYIERETGNLFVTVPIDREEYSEFEIICNARTLDGYTPEVPLRHVIRIEDDNDNPPMFDPVTWTFNVIENCRAGTVVGQITATDRDEPDTLHTKLKYRIVGQNPIALQGSNTFSIHPDTGSITVAYPVLDREKITTYTILVEARDMGGQPFGLCNTATVVIEVDDANDHAPMCEHSMYEAYVNENTVGAKVMDIGAVDKDSPGTPAWHATFNIIKGNEDGAFKIVKNSDSNIGTLCVEKGLDYERNKERKLEIVVNNEAPYFLPPNSRAISTSTCVVYVRVRDVDEGPEFDPCVLFLNIKECLPAETIVGQYTARDPENGNSEGIIYRIIDDPCNWITIDNAGQIRTTRLLDREQPQLQLYQCNVTVSATDRNGKTGTGVIVANLLDENDNFPMIPKTEYIICRDRQPVCLTAVDADSPEHGAPFSFSLPDRMIPQWRLTQHDENSAYLVPAENLPFGAYDIPVMVTDRAGKGGISEIRVIMCDCTTPSDCRYWPRVVPPLQPGARQSPNVTLGLWAILAMIGGSLLLLLILITLCGCCGAAPVSSSKHVCDDLANQNLIISNTEAPGEEVMDHNILPVKTGNMVTCDQGTLGVKTGGQESFEMVKGHQTLESVKGGGHQTLESVKMGHQTLESGRGGYGQSAMDAYRYSYSDWQNFTHPRLTEKVYLCGQDEEHKHSEDYVLSYNYEGRGSLAGSVGCCTDQQDEEALDFLDQLEPKFRTLAETCIKR